MLAHLPCIFIEEFENKKSDIILRTVYRFNQFTTNSGKGEIKKINMRLTQIIYQSWNGNFSVISIQPGKTFSYKVDNNKKSPTVYSVKFTNFFDRFITKSQRKSETTHHLQQRIVITDKINHLIGWFIFL